MRQLLEYAVAADDVLASLNYYKALGFQEQETVDSVPYAYGVVTDGRIAIGLHNTAGFSAELRMVQSEVQKAVLDWSETSAVFEEVHLDEDELHRATLDDPSGHRLTLIEARTFSPAADASSSALGRFRQIRLSVDDLLAAAKFWAPFADEVVSDPESDSHLTLRSGRWLIDLSEQARYDALEFECEDSVGLMAALAQLGLSLRSDPDDPEAQLLMTPEGTRLSITGLIN